MIFKSDEAKGDLSGFLDAGSHMQGELRFDNTFRIDGKFSGRVISEGDLVVGERGEIDGEIRVGRVFISGAVKGTVEAIRRIEIAPSGRVFAEIHTPALVVEDGAFLEGQCAMVREHKTLEETASVPKLVRSLPVTKEQ